jgi:hypothetical protein
MLGNGTWYDQDMTLLYPTLGPASESHRFHKLFPALWWFQTGEKENYTDACGHLIHPAVLGLNASRERNYPLQRLGRQTRNDYQRLGNTKAKNRIKNRYYNSELLNILSSECCVRYRNADFRDEL